MHVQRPWIFQRWPFLVWAWVIVNDAAPFNRYPPYIVIIYTYRYIYGVHFSFSWLSNTIINFSMSWVSPAFMATWSLYPRPFTWSGLTQKEVPSWHVYMPTQLWLVSYTQEHFIYYPTKLFVRDTDLMGQLNLGFLMWNIRHWIPNRQKLGFHKGNWWFLVHSSKNYEIKLGFTRNCISVLFTIPTCNLGSDESRNSLNFYAWIVDKTAMYLN